MSLEFELAKMFTKGVTYLVMLAILYRGSMHGYEIVKELSKLTGLEYTPGAVYPILYKLESLGLIEGRWIRKGKRRMVKLYEITVEGRRVFTSLKARFRRLSQEVFSG